MLSFDVDAESALGHRDPSALTERMGLAEERRYGPRVGLPRILNLLSERGIKGSFFIPAFTVTHHRSAVEQIVEAGHEIACHGDQHEPLAGLTEEAEERILVSQLETMERHLGIRPSGYRSPSWDLNLRTPDLLRRHGFTYDSSLMGSDLPYMLPTDHGTLVEVPVQWMLDDAPYYRHVYGAANQFADPLRVVGAWRQEFEALHADNGCFVLTMHPWVTGRPSRLAALGQLLDVVQSREDVWITTCGEVAAWAASRPEQTFRAGGQAPLG